MKTEADLLAGMERVRRIAIRFAHNHPKMRTCSDELIGAGNLGLAKAWKSYDQITSVPFAVWAAIKIESAIREEIECQYRHGVSISISMDTGNRGRQIDFPAQAADATAAIALSELRQCAGRLPHGRTGGAPPLRAVARLTLDGAGLQEIGERLGITEGNACILRESVIDRLRAMMGHKAMAAVA